MSCENAGVRKSAGVGLWHGCRNWFLVERNFFFFGL